MPVSETPPPGPLPQDFRRYFDAAVSRYGRFGHPAHLHVAWAMLRDFPALEALAHFRTGLRALAAALDVPEKYHETRTVAWFVLVLERLDRAQDWDTFCQRHPELFGAQLLERFYTPAELDSAPARRGFVLPQPEREKRLS